MLLLLIKIGYKSLPENTDDKIVKFNNPLSDKEFNVVKDLIISPMSEIKLVNAKQEGTKLIFNYNEDIDYPEGEYTIKVKNKIGLDYERMSGSDSRFEEFKINVLDNGGYAFETLHDSSSYIGYDRDVKYFDKDLNLKDSDWYMQEKALREKIEKEISTEQMEAALENIKNGKPAQYKLDDNYLILLPKPNKKVVFHLILLKFFQNWFKIFALLS